MKLSPRTQRILAAVTEELERHEDELEEAEDLETVTLIVRFRAGRLSRILFRTEASRDLAAK